MIRYCKNYNGTIESISTSNSVPSATNTNITNNSFDDYFQPQSIPFRVEIQALIDSTHIAVCIGFGKNVTVSVDNVFYKVSKMGALIIDRAVLAGDQVVLTINSEQPVTLNFLQLCELEVLENDYESGFLYSELVSARKNATTESFGAPSGSVSIRRSIPVTLNLPNVRISELSKARDFQDPSELKIADFDGVYLVLFDVKVNTSRHGLTEDLVVVSAKYKVWGN